MLTFKVIFLNIQSRVVCFFWFLVCHHTVANTTGQVVCCECLPQTPQDVTVEFSCDLNSQRTLWSENGTFHSCAEHDLEEQFVQIWIRYGFGTFQLHLVDCITSNIKKTCCVLSGTWLWHPLLLHRKPAEPHKLYYIHSFTLPALCRHCPYTMGSVSARGSLN